MEPKGKRPRYRDIPTNAMAKEEAQWKRITGLYIIGVNTHYQVWTGASRDSEGAKSLFASAQRHECRAYIRGYIQGKLDGMRETLDTMKG